MKYDCTKTIDYMKVKKIVCEKPDSSCFECPLGDYPNCDFYENMKEKIEALQKWADNNTGKTRMEEFLEKYPNARLVDGMYPPICPLNIDKRLVKESFCIIGKLCRECKNDYWNEVI